jgi:signal transduction histidine kinase
LFDQILDLVGQPPGSLVYHFIILFAIEAAFAIGIGQWMRERDSSTLRLAIAIFGILLARVGVLIASLAAWQGYLPYNVLLPPVERAVDTLTVVGLAWAFVTMDDPRILRRNFALDVAAVVAAGLVLIGFGGTYYYWLYGAASGQLFNGIWLDVAWNIAQIVLVTLGIIGMLARARYVYDPFIKGIMLIVLALAAAIHLVRPALGDVPAAMRVGQLVVMPMLAAIAYRHVVEQLLHWDAFEPSRSSQPEGAALFQPAPAEPAAIEPPPGSLDETIRAPQPPEAQKEAELARQATVLSAVDVVEAVGGLLSTLEPKEIVKEVPRAVATALRADICVLAIVDEDVQHAGIVGGYDNIAQTALPQATLNLRDHPTVVNTLGRLRQMRLTTQHNLRELRDLYGRLAITHEGPAYLQPLVNGEERVGVLIVGSPYSERLLSNEERNLLDRMGPLVTAALLNSETYRSAVEETEQASGQEAARAAALADDLTARTTELNAAQRQIEEMKAYIRDMHRQLDDLPQQQEVAREQIESLAAEISRLRPEAEKAQELQRQLDDLRAQLAAHEAQAPSLDRALLERQVEEARLAAQGEIAALRMRLAQATISQQEVTFLQEQLAAKAREAIQYQAKLTETQAVADALREQLGSGLTSIRQLEALQARVAEQAAEMTRLQAELAEARATASLSGDALRAQQDMDQFDREAMAQLEAQLAERAALAGELERHLIDKTRAVVTLKAQMVEVNSSLRSLEEQLSHKTAEIAGLQESLARTRAEAQERIAALQAEMERGGGDLAAVDRARMQAMEAELAEKTAAIETLQEQLRSTTQAMGALGHQLSAANEVVGAAMSGAEQANTHDEVIASIAQELRTPMSSIMGYTELLLRESVGILGPLQRKFLQRVKANTERMGALLDDLIRITTLDAGRLQLESEKVDVLYTLEEVVMNVANVYNEKGLTLRLALPQVLPPITADREALLEIIGYLLSNAALASPVEGKVELVLEAREESLADHDGGAAPVPCLYIAVQDSGKGVDPEDYGRVFAARYRADNPLIEGLGDTGVSLSLAKLLVDAHSGRIWIDSRKGEGTTFHVLLPIDSAPQGAAQ